MSCTTKTRGCDWLAGLANLTPGYLRSLLRSWLLDTASEPDTFKSRDLSKPEFNSVANGLRVEKL